MTTIHIETKKQEMLPITVEVQRAVENSGIASGLCCVYSPHTTAGIAINENADPDVTRDLLLAMDETFPDREVFRHMEGNSSAHLKAGLTGTSVTIPVENGRLCLGRWQGVYFCEYDGPRQRMFYVQVVGA